MSRYIIVLLCSVVMSAHVSLADVPMLDATTVTMPKAKVLNKCTDTKGKIIYTQFECKSGAERAEEGWQDKANLTYSTRSEQSFGPTDDILSAITGGQRNHPEQKNFESQSGMDMLKDAMKDKPLTELFDDGIKALMLRQQILNSL